MTISSIKIVSSTNPQNSREIIKTAIDETTNEVLGTLKARRCDNDIYSEGNFPRFYIKEKTRFKTVAQPHIYVNDIFVKQEARHKGVGTKLIKDIIKESADKGCEGRVVLFAFDKESSPIGFYRKLGFTTGNTSLNKRIDEILKYKSEIDKNLQTLMSIPKEKIAKILKTIR